MIAAKKREVQNLNLSKMAVSSPARLYPAIGVMAGARYRSHIRMASSSTIPLLRESNDSRQIKRALRRILELSKMAATYSPTNAVPSAMLSLTTLFGMGRGGTSTL